MCNTENKFSESDDEIILLRNIRGCGQRGYGYIINDTDNLVVSTATLIHQLSGLDAINGGGADYWTIKYLLMSNGGYGRRRNVK